MSNMARRLQRKLMINARTTYRDLRAAGVRPNDGRPVGWKKPVRKVKSRKEKPVAPKVSTTMQEIRERDKPCQRLGANSATVHVRNELHIDRMRDRKSRDAAAYQAHARHVKKFGPAVLPNKISRNTGRDHEHKREIARRQRQAAAR